MKQKLSQVKWSKRTKNQNNRENKIKCVCVCRIFIILFIYGTLQWYFSRYTICSTDVWCMSVSMVTVNMLPIRAVCGASIFYWISITILRNVCTSYIKVKKTKNGSNENILEMIEAHENTHGIRGGRWKIVYGKERARAKGTKKANEWKEHAFNEHFRVLNFLYRSFESGRQVLRALVCHSVAMARSFSLRSASVSLSFVSLSISPSAHALFRQFVTFSRWNSSLIDLSNFSLLQPKIKYIHRARTESIAIANTANFRPFFVISYWFA